MPAYANVRRAMTVDEIHAFLAASPDGSGRHFVERGKLRQMWTLFLCTGMRKGEVVGMPWKEVDLDAGTITLPAERTKTGEARTVYLGPRVVEMLSQLGPKYPDAPVMSNRDGEPFNNNVLRKFQMCCKRAGIPLRTSLGKLDVHAMRKTFRTIITEDLGASVKVGDFMLGHKGSERSLGTRVYTQVREYRVREVATQVEDLVLDPSAGPVVGRIPRRA